MDLLSVISLGLSAFAFGFCICNFLNSKGTKSDG